MIELTPPPRQTYGQLLRAAEGLTQWRPMALGFLTMVACTALMSVGMYLSMRVGGMAGVLLGGVVGLLVAALAASGFSGVGVMLMDKARQQPVRSMGDALVFGLLCLPKFIGFALLLLVLVLALALVGALVYLLCKLPVLGPLLLFVMHPVLVVGAAVVFTTVGWVAIPLFTPAVWDGRGFKESLSLVLAVARTRLVQVVALLLGLSLVVAIVGMLVSAALLPGYGFMTGLAASVLGKGVFAGGMLSPMGGLGMGSMGGFGMGGGAGLLMAGMLSSMLIFGVAATLMFQVLLMGVNLVYLCAIEGVDIAAGTQALDAGIARARERAQQAQEGARKAAELAQQRAREAAERARQAMPQAASAAAQEGAAQPPVRQAQEATGATPEPLRCPQCDEEVGASDLFCGSCGHRMA